MGHFKNLKKEYQELAGRLNQGGTLAFVEPESERSQTGWQEMFEILYSPEDAALAAKMPLLPEELPALSKRLGMTEVELKARLDPMCDKGIVMDLVDPQTQVTTYFLSPPLVGFIEFSFMRARDSIPKKRMAQALDDYLYGDGAFVREVFGGNTPLGRTLAYETTIPEDLPEVLDWERASGIIRNARAVAVSLCSCRHKAQHLGGSCNAPLENCMTLNAGAEFVIRRGFGRAIDQAEGLEILATAREHGLVHIADNVRGQPIFLCSCCSCCCEQLRAINRYDMRGINPSGFVASCSGDKCVGCSKCAQACPVGAITLMAQPISKPCSADGGRKNKLQAIVDPNRCLGCGICVGTCRTNAMSMLRRKNLPHVPTNAVERVVRTAIERNRLADLLIEQGRGLGSRFLNRALTAILRLPPAQRILASEQLRSRFVQIAVARIKDPLA